MSKQPSARAVETVEQSMEWVICDLTDRLAAAEAREARLREAATNYLRYRSLGTAAALRAALEGGDGGEE